MIKFFKKHKNFKKESSWLNLNFYWKLVVCTTLLMAIASIFFGYYFFRQISKENNAELVGGEELESVKKERVEETLEYFSSRKQKSNQIINSPSPVLDPSF